MSLGGKKSTPARGGQTSILGFFSKAAPTKKAEPGNAESLARAKLKAPQPSQTKEEATKPTSDTATSKLRSAKTPDTPPPTVHRQKSNSSDFDGQGGGSSPPLPSPTAARRGIQNGRQQQQQTSPVHPRFEERASKVNQAPPSREPTPPSSDAMSMELDDDEDGMPVRRRSATKRTITYAESDVEGEESEAGSDQEDSFVPSKPKKGRASGNRRPSKRSRITVEDDEDDFIVSDDDPVSDHFSESDMDGEVSDGAAESDEGSPSPKAKKKNPKSSSKRPSAGTRSSPLESFKLGASASSPSAGARLSPNAISKPSLSTSHLTKAERRIVEEKRRKTENEQAYSFLVDLRDKDGNRPGDTEYDSRTVYIPKSAWKDFTPFEKQFWEIKQNHWDTVLFFQKGKFYELYEEDALIGHREFDLKLTDRVKMKMVGVPESSFDIFAAKFLALGYKVGRVDQTETAVAKGMRVGEKSRGGGSEIVHRELRHVLTGGTIVDASALPDDLNSYCISIKEQLSGPEGEPVFGVCILDASTAQFNLTSFQDDVSRTRLETLLRSLRLKEVIHEKAGLATQTLRVLRNSVPHSCQITMLKSGSEFLDEESTMRKLNTLFNEELSPDDDFESVDPIDASLLPDAIASMVAKPCAISALGGLLSYLAQLNLDRDLCSSRNFNIFDPIRQDKCLILDAQSLTHLNILLNDQGTEDGTLHRLLNRCVTPFGKRLFKIWVIAPLAAIEAINARLDAVDDLLAFPQFEEEFDSFAKKLPDTERLIPRIYAGKCRPKDFTTVLKSFAKFDESIKHLIGCTEDFTNGVVTNALRSIPNVSEKANRLREMFKILEDGSFVPLKQVHEDFDIAEENLAKIEAELETEIEKYRKQLGLRKATCDWKHIGTKDIYQVEVPAKTKVPSNWVRLSQTKDKHRYYSPAVRDLVQELKEARETRLAAMKQFHSRLFNEFTRDGPTYLAAIKGLAEIDCLLSLAKSSYAMGEPTCRPEFVEHDTALVEFEELRHPCMGGDTLDFIPNNVKLGGDNDEVVVLTGGNMAGKSTTARTTATAVIIAQLGCRVPASKARISPVDRIASRMGANDQIFRNNSTFMVEMLEASRIISECTPRSLVVMDELGRGTSTFDGQAIAFAVLHHLVGRTRCLAFFLTHYTTLAYDFDHYPRVSNKHMEVLVDDQKREVVFTYRLVPGIAESSYGTQVAALAGVPHEICDRASDVSKQFLDSTRENQARKAQSKIPLASLADFAHLFRMAESLEALSADEAKIKVAASQLDVIRAEIANLGSSASLGETALDTSASRSKAKEDLFIIPEVRPSSGMATYGGRQKRVRLQETVSNPSTPRKSRTSNGKVSGEMVDDLPDKSFSSPTPCHINSLPMFRTTLLKRVPLKPAQATRSGEQLVLDLGQKIRITCKDCDMSFDKSSPDDSILHSKYHERVVKGLDWTAKTLINAGDEVVSSFKVKPRGGDGSRSSLGFKRRGSGNPSSNGGGGANSEEVRILLYKMENVKDSIVNRKLSEVLAMVDEALGAAALPDHVVRACQILVAVRGGRVAGAAVLCRVPQGTARRVIPAGRISEEAPKTTPAEAMRVYDDDGGDAIFVSDPLPPSQTPPIGVHRIHVLPALRRTGLATRLLEAAGDHFVYGQSLKSLERMYGGRAGTVAFSQPTEAGRKFAESWIVGGDSIQDGSNQAVSDKRLIVFEE